MLYREKDSVCCENYREIISVCGEKCRVFNVKEQVAVLLWTGRDCILVTYNVYQRVVRGPHNCVRDTYEVNLHFHIDYHYYTGFLW